MRTRIKRGLNLPVSGAPGPEIVDGPAVSRVAILQMLHDLGVEQENTLLDDFGG